jgi:hypothetical protein
MNINKKNNASDTSSVSILMMMMMMMMMTMWMLLLMVTEHTSKTLFFKLNLTRLITHKSNHVTTLNSFIEQTLLHGKQENFFFHV